MSHLSLDEVLSWLTAKTAVMTTAFVQTTIPTGLSIERSIVMLIHRIEWFVPTIQAADGTIDAQLTRTSQSAILSPENPLIISVYNGFYDFTTSGQIVRDMPKSEIYVIPPVIATPNIYFACKPSVTPSPDVAYIRIGYSIKTVAEKDFFKLATALVT